MNPEQDKNDLRRIMRARRLRESVPAESTRLLNRLLFKTLMQYPDAQRIACVWPLPGEADLRPLCTSLHAAGRKVLLPETTPRGQALVFRQWSPDCSMRIGRFGTSYPDMPYETPELVLVPLLAFDRQLNRLGYGGGYYDRTLAALQCPAIGFAYSWQEVDAVPTGLHDVPLARLVTERAVFDPPARKGALT